MRRIFSALVSVALAACGSVAQSRFTFGAISGGISPRPMFSIEIPREFRPDKQRPSGYPSDIEVHRWSRMSSQSIELSYCALCPPKREDPDMWLSIDEEAIE